MKDINRLQLGGTLFCWSSAKMMNTSWRWLTMFVFFNEFDLYQCYYFEKKDLKGDGFLLEIQSLGTWNLIGWKSHES